MKEEILNLKPANVWKNFYSICQIPHPSGHLKQITAFVEAFGKNLGLETILDNAGNVLIRKPATVGMENRKTVILQCHLDMVPQKNSSIVHDFTKDPILPYIVDQDWVKAKDTTLGSDNGIGMASVMSVLEDKSLKHGPIEALFTADEETGMFGAKGLKPGFLKGEILINTDSEDEGELFVGCAGGIDLNISFQYKDEETTFENETAILLSLTGLKGGHSGVDIHLGRANANKLMFRFLKFAIAEYETRLATISGGSLRNAIPREAFAVVTVPTEYVKEFIEEVADFEAMYKEEFDLIEGSIHFTATVMDKLPESLIPEQIQDDLINAVIGCRDGVGRMIPAMPNVVENSSNLAIITSEPGNIDIKILVRSTSESLKYELASSLESVFLLAGAKVEFSGAYPGWEPNPSSAILTLMKKVYKDKFGKDVQIKVIHAGLECGIIAGSTPNLDMISFGPTIRYPHSPDEKVNIVTVNKFWDYLVAVLENTPVR